LIPTCIETKFNNKSWVYHTVKSCFDTAFVIEYNRIPKPPTNTILFILAPIHNLYIKKESNKIKKINRKLIIQMSLIFKKKKNLMKIKN